MLISYSQANSSEVEKNLSNWANFCHSAAIDGMTQYC